MTNDSLNLYVYDLEGRNSFPQTKTRLRGPLIYAVENIAVGSACAAPTAANGFALTNVYLRGLHGDQDTELNGAGVWQHSNVWAGGKLVGTYDTKGLHFDLADPLGTKRVQANASGQVDEYCMSLPFGNDVNNPVAANCVAPNPAPATADDATEHHFTQKERDSETGNDYFGARYYASSMGRFISPDVDATLRRILPNPQRWNRYPYVVNNPLARFDPDGLQDIYVFLSYVGNPDAAKALSYMDRNGISPNWSKIQFEALAHGNHVHIYQGDDPNKTFSATFEHLQAALSKGQVTIDIGHTVLMDMGNGMKAQGIQMADGSTVGNAAYRSENPLTFLVSANGGTVAVFGCSSSDLSSTFPGASSFFGISSGRDQGVGGLDGVETSQVNAILGGAAFAEQLALGNDNSAAEAAANAQINPTGNGKDSVVQVAPNQ